MILGRLDTRDELRVILDDGRALAIDYDLLDACRLSHGDRVRVEVTKKRADKILPWRTTAEAIELLVAAKVLPRGTSSSSDDIWPRALLDIVFDHDTTDATFSHDHHYLEPSQLERWARRSELPSTGLDPEESQLYLTINRKLADNDSPYRWFLLASDDERSAYILVDRALADSLGLGIFDS